MAQAEDDGASGFCQRVAHFLIDGLHLFVFVNVAGAAPVVFQIVDTPYGIRSRVLLFMAVTALISGAGIRAGGGVDAELESFTVNVIGERLHIGELPVGGDVALRIAMLALPCIVDVDVLIACGFHAIHRHGVGDRADRRVIDASRELVPAIPAHGRGFGETIRGHRVQRRQVHGLSRHGACRVSAFARGRAMGDRFRQRRIRPAARADVQFISGELDFVCHFALAAAVHHGCRECECIGAARAFRDRVVELRRPDVPGNARPFLFQVKVGASRGAVVHILNCDPVSSQIGREGNSGKGQSEQRNANRGIHMHILIRIRR